MAGRRVQIYQTHTFTGGVNYRDDAYEVQEDESTDCLNVRIQPRGGFQRRKTMGVLNTTNFSSQAARNIWAFYGNGVNQILVQDGNDAKYSTGSATFTAINPDALTVAAGSRMRAATGSRVNTATSERCYVQRNAEQVAWKWDGTTATAMVDSHGAYNDNLLIPAGTKMPKAKYISAHAGFMFHANTVEAGAAKTSRLRWSHPGEHEDYRTNDYLDVGADDGDVVTGLASVGQYLFIFKVRSVWLLTGYDPTTFQLTKVTDTVGAIGQEAIARTEHAVFFFDSSRGMFSVTPQLRALPRVEWLWDRIYIRLTDNTIPPVYLNTVTVGYLDERVWVAVPWGASTVPKRVFVFDPQCGKNGAWYPYEFGDPNALNEIGPFLEWRPNVTQSQLLCCGNDGKNVFTLQAGIGTADATGGATTASYPSYFRTGWYAAGLPGVKKRWRRPTFVVDADNDYTLAVSAYTDYDETAPKMVQSCDITALNAGGGHLWGSNNWGVDNWGPASDGNQRIKRCTGFGSAYSVQLQFDGPQTLPWGVNALDLRYLPKRIR